MASAPFTASHSTRIGGAVLLFALASTLTGCIADGPDGSPLAPNLSAASAKAAETSAAKQALATGAAPSAKDVQIAAREARQARESGTISGSAALDRLIEKHARENDLPPALAYAVVRVESRYNPRAIGGGAMGLSQIKPATARSLGFSGASSRLLDADTNLTYGMRYLKGAWEQGGHDVCRTSMKYKGGHRTTRMTSAALRYCSAVKAHMAEVMRQRSRMPGETPEPEKKGFVETLVATVAPGASAAPDGGKKASTRERTPLLSAFAARGVAKAPATTGSLFATTGSTSQGEDETVAAAAPVVAPAAPENAGKGSRARSKSRKAAQDEAKAPVAPTAPSGGSAPVADESVDSRIADAFN